MMNPGGAGGDRRYRAIEARQTGRYIVMTLHFENKLHSNCKSQPVKHTHGPHPSKLRSKIARQDLGWSDKGAVGQRT